MRKPGLRQRTRPTIATFILGAMLTGSSIAYAQNATDESLVIAKTEEAAGDQSDSANGQELAPLYGNIDPFYGNISPFWGTISPFYGNIRPFWGNISPFYGNISPFWGNIDPFTAPGNSLAPSWGNIQPFWENVGGQWNRTNALWADSGRYTLKSAATYALIASRIEAMAAESKSVWGTAVSDATGQSFEAAFLNPLYAKYGVDLDKPESLARLGQAERAQFFMDWYDGLMNFSGVDRVDHWMRTANWSPAITQQQGAGADTVIGIMDGAVSDDIDLADNIISATGYKTGVQGHGIGVASLIAAAHDGDGVMGIAPNARVALHNPFGRDNRASWRSVRNGIHRLKQRRASVINMSLGVPGMTLSENWNDVFGTWSVRRHNRNTVYVLAAGNDGVTQSDDIEWGKSLNTNFLVVGSVDPAGNISSFSNRPGDACLLDYGVCNQDGGLAQGGLLMNRFLVAPGEALLMSDGHGGTVRRTGTSFAAPLVSGAIALLHDRWPWLAKNPEASVKIILGSARDLGEPGVDAVYGHGLLDITASQSPLDWDRLSFFKVKNRRYSYQRSASLQAAGVNSTWEADGVHFLLFERVGNTYRDFAVPMSTQLSGSMTTVFGNREQYQNFLTQRLTDYIRTGSAGFSDVASYTTPDHGGWQMSIAAANPTAFLTDRSSSIPHSAIKASAPGSRLSLTAGHGYGAMAIGSEQGFGLSSDYATDGGINPLLGLASGGGFVATDFALTKNTTVSFGFSSRDQAAADNPAFDSVERAALLGRDDYTASAMNLRLTHRASGNVSLSVNYTRLREDNALLAVQAENDLLDDGSQSETLTLSGTAQLPGNITLSGSATAGRTATADGAQQLATTNGGILTSAFAFSATKNGVLGNHDRLRLSIAQPMHIERGTLTLASVEVIDRNTGELGVVDQSFDIDQRKRLFTGEMIYAAPLSDMNGEMSFFGRATVGDASDDRTGIVAGARLKLQF